MSVTVQGRDPAYGTVYTPYTVDSGQPYDSQDKRSSLCSRSYQPSIRKKYVLLLMLFVKKDKMGLTWPPLPSLPIKSTHSKTVIVYQEGSQLCIYLSIMFLPLTVNVPEVTKAQLFYSCSKQWDIDLRISWTVDEADSYQPAGFPRKFVQKSPACPISFAIDKLQDFHSGGGHLTSR